MVQIIFPQFGHLRFTWNVMHTVLLHEIWYVWYAIFSSWCACLQWRYGLLCISHAYICNWLSYIQCGILDIAYILFHSHDKGFVIREMGTFAHFSYGKQATEYVRAHREYPYFRYKLWVQPWCRKYAIVCILSGDVLPQIVFYEIQNPYIMNK